MRRIFIILFLILFSSTLMASPFGLEKGMSIEQLTVACNGKEPELLEDDIYKIYPKKRHPIFEEYVAWISNSEGLYSLKTISYDINTTKYGTELKAQFENIEESLSKTYGIPERIDEIHPDSIFNDADYWMYALWQGDRVLYSVWLERKNASLPDSINGIALSAEATGNTQGYLILEYEFDNIDKVEEQTNSVF